MVVVVVVVVSSPDPPAKRVHIRRLKQFIPDIMLDRLIGVSLDGLID